MDAQPSPGRDAHNRRPAQRVHRALLSAVALILLAALFIPEREPPELATPGRRPFAWHQDAFWHELQRRFEAVRVRGCAELDGEITRALLRGQELIESTAATELPADAPVFSTIEKTIFELGPTVAACPGRLAEYARLVTTMRSVVKRRSQSWDLASPAVRDRIYRLLYGGRAALEEAILQAPSGAAPALLAGDNEPSQTPSARLLGITLHSGDLLLSRGGAAASALIARGNDYPGNFSHVAVLHVDESGQMSFVEAHIERGVAVATAAAYVSDTKLRIMALRLRADLPAVRADPLLPHRAASRALARARERHIPYDFAMDVSDHSRLFCSEVASAFYGEQGIALWMGLSTISSPSLAAWLAGFGVRHLITQEPSDLEYDPQLCVVAEWRDLEVLFKDHVDNAVIDVLLEAAERGRRPGYALTKLPLARAAKLYSAILNSVGGVGPIPEGMSAATALRAERLAAVHKAVADRVSALAAEFQAGRRYRPPYWELVRLAREACAELGCNTRL
jgi:hypothetical protein